MCCVLANKREIAVCAVSPCVLDSFLHVNTSMLTLKNSNLQFNTIYNTFGVKFGLKNHQKLFINDLESSHDASAFIEAPEGLLL